jgi:N-acetylneuraminic acid mutarotase
MLAAAFAGNLSPAFASGACTTLNNTEHRVGAHEDKLFTTLNFVHGDLVKVQADHGTVTPGVTRYWHIKIGSQNSTGTAATTLLSITVSGTGQKKLLISNDTDFDHVYSITCTSAPPPTTTLKVIKNVIPANDPGKFNLRIDGIVRAQNVGNGGATGAVPMSPGVHTVSETAGANTNLIKYRRSFSGACNAAGQVTLAAGDNKTCIITNKLREWSTRAPMPAARAGFGTGVISSVGGVIYVVGGANSGTSFPTLQVYRPITNSWTIKAPMPTIRPGIAAGVVNGILYAVGGDNNGTTVATVEAYNPATNSWTTKAPMPAPRSTHSVAVINGILYVVGGANISATHVNTVYAYNPVTNVWVTKTPMPTARSDFGLGVLNGKLYAVGGHSGVGHLASMHEYNPATDQWTAKPSMPTARFALAVGVANGILYAVGGRSAAGHLSKVEAYDLQSNSWSTVVPMPTKRDFLGVGVVNGILYAVGGHDGNNTLPTVEAYGP